MAVAFALHHLDDALRAPSGVLKIGLRREEFSQDDVQSAASFLLGSEPEKSPHYGTLIRTQAQVIALAADGGWGTKGPVYHDA